MLVAASSSDTLLRVPTSRVSRPLSHPLSHWCSGSTGDLLCAQPRAGHRRDEVRPLPRHIPTRFLTAPSWLPASVISRLGSPRRVLTSLPAPV